MIQNVWIELIRDVRSSKVCNLIRGVTFDVKEVLLVVIHSQTY